MDAIFEHWSRKLDELIESSPFYTTFLMNPYELEYAPETGIVEVACGATRLCFIDPEYNWVVKVDIGTDGLEESVCERELETYRAAVNCGCADYLAEMRYIGEYCKTVMWWDEDVVRDAVGWGEDDDADWWRECIDGIADAPTPHTIRLKLYACEYATTPEFQYGAYSKENANVASPLKKCSEVGITFEKDWGIEAFQRFTEFLKEYRINDLHCSNVGTIDGKMVLIDYGGYYTNERSCGDNSSERWNELD